jgi:hypothetical protein
MGFTINKRARVNIQEGDTVTNKMDENYERYATSYKKYVRVIVTNIKDSTHAAVGSVSSSCKKLGRHLTIKFRRVHFRWANPCCLPILVDNVDPSRAKLRRMNEQPAHERRVLCVAVAARPEEIARQGDADRLERAGRGARERVEERPDVVPGQLGPEGERAHERVVQVGDAGWRHRGREGEGGRAEGGEEAGEGDERELEGDALDVRVVDEEGAEEMGVGRTEQREPEVEIAQGGELGAGEKLDLAGCDEGGGGPLEGM